MLTVHRCSILLSTFVVRAYDLQRRLPQTQIVHKGKVFIYSVVCSAEITSRQGSPSTKMEMLNEVTGSLLKPVGEFQGEVGDLYLSLP